eukprot:gene22324-8770_t
MCVGRHDPPPPHPPADAVAVPRRRWRFRAAGTEIEGGCDGAADRWGACCGSASTGPGCGSAPGRAHDVSCPSACAFAAPDTNGVDRGARRFHDRVLELGPFRISRTPVTKAEYAAYLADTAYRPSDERGWLADWGGGDAARQPVVHVSLKEAAICTFGPETESVKDTPATET